MKVKIPLLLVLLLAGAVGYLMGTAKGREQRDQIIVKVRERRGGDDQAETSLGGDANATIDDTETAEEPDAASVS